MKIYIIKHYWKDGENAIWECHDKVNKNLFTYVKNNYHNFKENRPKSIKEGKYFIYFCYDDKKDFADRKITNITFFISKKKTDYNFCKEAETQNLELTVPQKLELTVLLKSNNFFIFSFVILLIAGLVFYKSTTNNTSKNIPLVIKNDYSTFINSWNKQVQYHINKDDFMLSRDDNQTIVINELNKIINNIKNEKNYVIKSIKDCEERKSSKKSLSASCERLDTYPINMDLNITFTKEMTNDEIKNKFKVFTGKTTMSGIVERVLSLSDIEVWKKNE